MGITEAGTIISGISNPPLVFRDFKSGNRGYHPGIPYRRPGRGNQVGEADFKNPRASEGGIEVVSCPTCGRTKIDLIGLANQVETLAAQFPLDIKVAVMGCAVNGPGEAKEADIGIAGGIGEGLLIKKEKLSKRFLKASCFLFFRRNWTLERLRKE